MVGWMDHFHHTTRQVDRDLDNGDFVVWSRHCNEIYVVETIMTFGDVLITRSYPNWEGALNVTEEGHADSEGC